MNSMFGTRSSRAIFRRIRLSPLSSTSIWVLEIDTHLTLPDQDIPSPGISVSYQSPNSRERLKCCAMEMCMSRRTAGRCTVGEQDRMAFAFMRCAAFLAKQGCIEFIALKLSMKRICGICTQRYHGGHLRLPEMRIKIRINSSSKKHMLYLL